MSAVPLPVTPAPKHGDVFVGRDAVGRVLRISGHPDADRVVLSIWQGPNCVATVRLATADIPDVVSTLVRTSLPGTPSLPGPPPTPAPAGSVSPIRLPAAEPPAGNDNPERDTTGHDSTGHGGTRLDGIGPDRLATRLRRALADTVLSVGTRIAPPARRHSPNSDHRNG